MLWIGWLIGALYGLVIRLGYIAAMRKHGEGWRWYLMWIGLLALPLFPMYGLIAANMGVQLSFLVGAVFGYFVTNIVEALIFNRVSMASDRRMRVSDETADELYWLIMRDQAATAKMADPQNVLLMLLVVLVAWALQLPVLFGPLTGGRFDALFGTLQWVGLGIGALAFIVYAGGILTFYYRSLWRTCHLTEVEFDAALDRFGERARRLREEEGR